MLVPQTFISGTFDDIKDLRARVIDVLAQQRIVSADLRHSGKATTTVKDLINGELDQSDYCICIIGNRYGSRIEGIANAPSWTHYEYDRFQSLLYAKTPGQPPRKMLVLVPELRSEADLMLRERARDVMQRIGLSPEERERDKKTLEYFKRWIQGAEVGLPDPHLLDPLTPHVTVGSQRAAQATAPPFRDHSHFEKLILLFLLEAQRVAGHHSGAMAMPQPAQGPPVARPTVDLPATLLHRLAPTPRPAALCAVTTRLDDHGLGGGDVTTALVHHNPWADGETERLLDWSGLTVADRKIDSFLRILAEEEFGVGGGPLDDVITGIAARVVARRRPCMVRITGLSKTGIAENLLTDIWPKLEKALREGRAPDNPAGLFLILSVELGQPEVEALCQRACDTPAPLSKPILVTSNSLGLDALPRPADSDQKEPPP